MKGALVPRNTFLLLRLSSENSIPYVFCGETHLARQHALLRPIASLASNSAAYCACQFPCWATPAASSSHSHTFHTLTRFTFTRFTFTHASHHTRFTSHTLRIHTRFALTHTHTRDSLFDSCRILCLSVSVLGNTGSVKFTFTHAHTRLAKGNTGSVRFTFTHASHSRIENTHTLVKGLRRCIIYLL